MTRPKPTDNGQGGSCDNGVTWWEWGNLRPGFSMWGQGTVKDNVFRDIVATGNMGSGWEAAQPYVAGVKSNNVVDRATLWGNGADVPNWQAVDGPNISIRMDGVNPPTNSKIAGSRYNDPTGGADMRWRYVDRVQQVGTPVLPWPMQARIMAELGVDVNAIWTQYTQEAAEQ
jgi:hypothetical protein